jgi:simple sugar transport system permease protein
MSAGRGYIALAVVIAARWNPFWAVVIAFLFGGATAIGYQIQAVGVGVPFQLMRALPYLATLAVYAGLIGRVRAPDALGQRWLRT